MSFGPQRPAGPITQAGNHGHTQRPPRTLAAVRSPGTARHASRATAPSIRTAKEARDWAIGGRHGEIRARMCKLPYLPHDAQIPDQRFTLREHPVRKAREKAGHPLRHALEILPLERMKVCRTACQSSVAGSVPNTVLAVKTETLDEVCTGVIVRRFCERSVGVFKSGKRLFQGIAEAALRLGIGDACWTRALVFYGNILLWPPNSAHGPPVHAAR